MNLSQLEVLVAIVDTGSLTEAAEVVGLTQSAVSYSLSRLESGLGVTLLERGRQGIAITQIGEEVLHHARVMISQAEIIRQKTGRERGVFAGKLRFGCIPNVAPRLLTGIMREFQHQYPEVEIILFEGNAEELREWLMDGVIDIGITLFDEKYGHSMPLACDEIKVVVPTNHAFASRKEIRVEDLQDEAIIGPKTSYAMMEELLGKSIASQFPVLRYEVSSQNTIMAMVRENMGITFILVKLTDADLEDTISIPLYPPLTINVFLATNNESPASQAFLKTAHNWAKLHGFLPNETEA